MKRKLFFTLLVAMLFALNVVPSSAQISVGISSFTTSFNNIGWDALNNRTARIPVSWTTQNRLLTSNLVFEQILPDGSRLNVELPRLIPYVASNGDGVVAPILPTGNVSEIQLRVSLVNLITGSVYDIEEIFLPIISGDSGSGDSGRAPAIVSFESGSTAPISLSALRNGTARVPVNWSAINRPITANLLFEQVLSDGSVVNVELPRPFAWVNSSDSGLVAPILPNDDASEIVLRISLVDMIFQRLLDQRYLYIPIQTVSNPPEITIFSTGISDILDEAINDSLIDVNWVVSNRPSNTNLVFEQVLPDGTVRNAELPRDFIIVPSSGNGIVDPILPQGNVNTLVFRLSLVDLSSNTTLTSAEITINIVRVGIGDHVVVSGDACYTGSFAPSQNLINGSEGRIQYRDNGISIPVYGAPDNNDEIIARLNAGDSITIQDAPYCSYSLAYGYQTSRRWLILVNGEEGWIEEYSALNDGSYIFNFIRADRDDIPTISIDSFTVNPTSVAIEDLNTTTFTVTWTTQHAMQTYMSFVETVPEGDSGSITVNGADISPISDTITFYIHATDAQYNSERQEIIVPIQSNSAINNFSVTPDTTSGTQQITFTWDLEGDFENAVIWTSAPYSAQLEVIHTISSYSGSFTYTLPDNYAERTLDFTLDMLTSDGINLRETVSINYTCAYEWGLNITNDECPSTPLTLRQGAYQVFQNGFVVWLPSEDESLWVFYNDGSVERYVDAWDGSDYSIDDTPPDGTVAPERGFGYLWQTVPAVREGLGWATNTEQGYNVSYQAALFANRHSLANYYLQLPDGRVIHASQSELGAPLRWIVQ